MYIRTQMNLVQITVIMLSLLVGMPVFAVTIAPVDIIEDFKPSKERGQLTVNNSSSQPIYAFAVGNNDASKAFGFGATRGLADLIPSELDNLWAASVIRRSSWEANTSVFGKIGNNATWTAPDTSTAAYNWDTLFGSAFDTIVSYWVVDPDAALLGFGGHGLFSTPINSGSSQSHFFFFSKQANSPFITLGNDGTVTPSGETTLVPIPATIWLFGSALLGLFRISRRK
jgi:hypothetical protein